MFDATGCAEFCPTACIDIGFSKEITPFHGISPIGKRRRLLENYIFCKLHFI